LKQQDLRVHRSAPGYRYHNMTQQRTAAQRSII
jgi:hypothetical protein